MERHAGPAEIAEIGKVRQQYGRTEADVVAAGLPVERTYRKDGNYSWRCEVPLNDGHGRLTKQGGAVSELMVPGFKADQERVAKRAPAPTVALRDADGGVHYVSPLLAGQTARSNGWGHHWRAVGAPVERGADNDMLFRLLGGEWTPLGVRCLGTPLSGEREMPKDGVYRSPDGLELWEWNSTECEWERLR